jgi:integrase
MARRTISQLDFESYPTPGEILKTIMENPGYPYQVNPDYYLARDRALISLAYLGALRISEILRLTKTQLQEEEDRWVFRSVQVSKRHMIKGASTMRSVWLPKSGERLPFTNLILDWIKICPTDQLFTFTRREALRVTTALTGKWLHYYRAVGEAYLYDAWGHDLNAVSDYVNVSVAMLGHYIRGAHRTKRPV